MARLELDVRMIGLGPVVIERMDKLRVQKVQRAMASGADGQIRGWSSVEMDRGASLKVEGRMVGRQ